MCQSLLFVDDEPALVTLTVRGLSKLGYRITGCCSPLQALAEFAAQPQAFDAVITDLSMPALSGFALARRLYTLRHDIPIVVMSGYVSATDRAEADVCGIREIVLKPITLDKLDDALARLFDARASATPW
jgi:CheY-like chemotaxis protein